MGQMPCKPFSNLECEAGIWKLAVFFAPQVCVKEFSQWPLSRLHGLLAKCSGWASCSLLAKDMGS